MAEPARQIFLQQRRLENGLILQFHDASRPLVGGRTQVRLILSIEIPVDMDHLGNTGEDSRDIQGFHEEFGDHIVFEQEHIRNFVPTEEVEPLLRAMIRDILASIGGYLSRPRFAERYLRIKLAAWKQKNALRRAIERHRREG